MIACTNELGDAGRPGTNEEHVNGDGDGDGVDDTQDPTSEPGLVASDWCDALAVFRAHCQSCHGSERRTGAPMSLVNYADLQQPAVTAPEHKVFEQVALRIHDERKPMPPFTPLSADERATLDRWITGGALPGPDVTCQGLPEVAPPTPAPEEEWECDERYTVLAHDPNDPSQPFRIGAGEEIRYQLPIETPPWHDDDVQGITFLPINDNTKVLHHWVLYEGIDIDHRGAFIWAWAPGNEGGFKLPDDVGLYLPQGPLHLELHYYNVGGSEVEFDRSGFEVCATRTPRKHIATVTNDFNAFPLLTPGMRQSFQDICRVVTTTDEDMHLVGVAPHMHKLGVHAFLSVTHDSEERVLHDMPYSFSDQLIYPLHDEVIRSGDVVTSRCTWENTTDHLVGFGQSSDDEMCANFSIYWPMGGYYCLGI
ncbi:MAG: hypothetical protein QM778_30365 [Myxococcales bacterium]